MTIDEVKDYLYQVRNLDKLIDLKQKQLDELNIQKYSIGSQGGSDVRVQSSPSGDAIPRMIAKIIDLQQEINEDIDKFIDLKAEIIHKIDLLPNINHRSVLYDRYILYKTIPEIAGETPYCTRTIKRLHKAALEAFSEVISVSE